MATIKSYTDIKQSKKLAKILPLESADMYYFDDNGGEPNFKVRNGITYYYDSEDFLCCWSLTALLDVLPNYEINNFGDSIQLAVKNKALVTDEGETLLDLVVNMIIYLHELNLL